MEQKSTFWKTAALYGLYLGIALTLFYVILYVAGQSQNKTLALISYPLLAIGIIMAQINYRDRELGGHISYGQSVGFGAALMFFVGIITALYNLIIFKADPSLVEQAKIMQEEALLQRGMSEDEIEAAMAITSKMLTPGWMAIMSLFGSVLIGTIISLITSIFVKKEPNIDAFDEAMEDVKTEE